METLYIGKGDYHLHRSKTNSIFAKPKNHKLGLYLPLPILDKPWHSISMDFMYGFPTTKYGHDCVYA